MRFGWEVGGTCGWPAGGRGWAVGAGTTAGPARRAGEGVVVAMVVPSVVAPRVSAVLAAGDCTVGVPALPALVRAIVLAG